MRRYLSIILVLLQVSIAQSQQRFQGEYVFNGLEGEADFEFREGGEQGIIKNGKFRFRRHFVDSLDKNHLVKNRIDGNYLNNQKEGRWNYFYENHRAFLEDVVDNKVVADLHSHISELRASYSKGTPDGVWTFRQNEFKDDELRPKSSADRIQFKNGFITGEFQYKTFEGERSFFINGKLTDIGEMDGEWTLVYEQDSSLVSEVRNYEKGFLLGLVRRDLLSNDILDEVVYFSTIEKLNQIKNKENVGFDISERKFEVRYNDGFRKRFTEYQAQLPGNAFIEEFLKQLLQFEDEEYISESGDILQYPIYTRRFVFELTNEDWRKMEEIPAVYDIVKSKIEAYAGMNSLNLNKSKSDSLAFAHEFFQQSKRKFENFENLIDLISRQRIEFFDIRNYTRVGLEYVSATDTINYTFQEEPRQKIITFRRVIENDENFLSNFSEYLEEEMGLINEIGSYVEGELALIEQDQSIQELDAKIVTTREAVDTLYASYHPYNKQEEFLLESLRKNFLSEGFDVFLEKYANTEDYPDRLAQSELILDMLNELREQFEPLTRLFPAVDVLDELYKEEIFNPFTYSRYDRRVKERLFENGALKLFDHYFNELSKETDYTMIKVWIKKVQVLHNRMVDLRNEDTRKLERRLKNNTPVNRIESILDL